MAMDKTLFSLRKDKAMFAVIKTGGKQYKVAEGDEIIIEKLAVEAGQSVT